MKFWESAQWTVSTTALYFQFLSSFVIWRAIVGERRKVSATVQDGRVAGQREAETDGPYERTRRHSRSPRPRVSKRGAVPSQSRPRLRKPHSTSVWRRRRRLVLSTTRKSTAQNSYLLINPLTPTVAIWVQLQSILCRTGLSRHL